MYLQGYRESNGTCGDTCGVNLWSHGMPDATFRVTVRVVLLYNYHCTCYYFSRSNTGTITLQLSLQDIAQVSAQVSSPYKYDCRHYTGIITTQLLGPTSTGYLLA